MDFPVQPQFYRTWFMIPLALRNENLIFHLQIVTPRKKCRDSKKLTISRDRWEIEASKDFIGSPCVFVLKNINEALYTFH